MTGEKRKKASTIYFTRSRDRRLHAYMARQREINNFPFKVEGVFKEEMEKDPTAALYSVPGASLHVDWIMARIYEGRKYNMRVYEDKIGSCTLTFGQLHLTCMTLETKVAACSESGHILNMNITGMLEADAMYALPSLVLHDYTPTDGDDTVYEAWVPICVETSASIKIEELQLVCID